MKLTLENKIKGNKGITLIALVITIIVLLILAGISISMLSGDNSILRRAADAKTNSEKEQIIENVRLDILAEITNKKGVDLVVDEIKDILEIYFTSDTIPEDFADLTQEMTTKRGEYSVKLSDVLNGVKVLTPPLVETVPTTASYVGYYADFEADGTIDGVIYADLAIGNTGDGQFNDSTGNYTIPVETGLKNYYISKTNHTAAFGTKDVLSPTGNGKDRFYVMALEDVGGISTLYAWYNAARGHMSDYSTYTSTAFGKGKENTEKMITKWNAKEYGEQNTNYSYVDLWGVIQTQVKNGWFIPSKEEWSAFAEELDINSSNAYDFDLDLRYWSSSQSSVNLVWCVAFDFDCMFDYDADYNEFARLSTTF